MYLESLAEFKIKFTIPQVSQIRARQNRFAKIEKVGIVERTRVKTLKNLNVFIFEFLLLQQH